MYNDVKKNVTKPEMVVGGPDFDIPVLEQWYYRGSDGFMVRHRSDGPAMIHYNDSIDSISLVEWYIHGNRKTFSQWETYATCTREEHIEYKLKYG